MKTCLVTVIEPTTPSVQITHAVAVAVSLDAAIDLVHYQYMPPPKRVAPRGEIYST